jgi:hypothetical protein
LATIGSLLLTILRPKYSHTHTHTCMLLLFKREKVGGEEGGVPGSSTGAGLKWVRGSVGERGSAPKINRKNSKNAQRMK